MKSIWMNIIFQSLLVTVFSISPAGAVPQSEFDVAKVFQVAAYRWIVAHPDDTFSGFKVPDYQKEIRTAMNFFLINDRVKECMIQKIENDGLEGFFIFADSVYGIHGVREKAQRLVELYDQEIMLVKEGRAGSSDSYLRVIDEAKYVGRSALEQERIAERARQFLGSCRNSK